MQLHLLHILIQHQGAITVPTILTFLLVFHQQPHIIPPLITLLQQHQLTINHAIPTILMITLLLTVIQDLVGVHQVNFLAQGPMKNFITIVFHQILYIHQHHQIVIFIVAVHLASHQRHPISTKEEMLYYRQVVPFLETTFAKRWILYHTHNNR